MEGVEKNVGCTLAKNVKTFFLDTTTGKVVLGIGVAYVACKVVTTIKRRQRQAQWREKSKGKVILHQFMRGKLTPNVSPYALKLETYLRMADIPYEVENKDIIGPKGKSPYITLDGEDIPDSEMCIQFLTRKYGKDMSLHLTEEQRAIGHALQIMVDEHLLWGMAVWRYSFMKGATMDAIVHLNPIVKFYMKMVFPRRFKKVAHLQGMGRHTPEEIDDIVGRDLRTISAILGKKKFLFGDIPCEAECAVFAVLVQILWNSPGSNFVTLCDTELPNLREYCLRMKERFWKDWDQCLYLGN